MSFYLILSKQQIPDGTMTPQQDITMIKDKENQEDAMTKDDEAMRRTGGQYLNYTTENYDTSADKRRVLFFYASWCPTCVPADKDFADNSAHLPKDITVLRVNYNDGDTDENEKTLAKKYGVTYQHTFVQIDSDGHEITKWNGGATKELESNLK
mgnify:FL=1